MIRTGLPLLVSACLLAQPALAADRTVAITFDDLPYAGVIGEGDGALSVADVARLNARIRETLRRHSVPATGFVVERTAQALGGRMGAVLTPWTRRDLSLGNHSYSHADVNNLDLAGIEREIVDGEASIRPLMAKAGKPLMFMRFPMNHTGDTREKRDGIATLLERRGYRPAASTIDTSDYVFEQAYSAALRRADGACAKRIGEAYLRYSAIQIDYYAALDAKVLGHIAPEIALLHLNRLNADSLDDLLALYVSRGYRFVTLEKAQEDPAYAGTPTFVSRYGPMWGYRWARERGVKINGAEELEPPAWLADYARTEGMACAAAPSG